MALRAIKWPSTSREADISGSLAIRGFATAIGGLAQPANLHGRLTRGHIMRETQRESDAVNLLSGFEERRFLQRPEFAGGAVEPDARSRQFTARRAASFAASMQAISVYVRT